MVTIVREGRNINQPEKEYIYNVTCKYCDCEFNAEEDDYFWIITGHGMRDRTWICPSCKRSINAGQGGKAIVKIIEKPLDK